MHNSLLIETLYFLAAAVLIVPIFKRLGLGSVLGYLTAGLLIGPQGIALIDNVSDVLHFAEIGVVLMLFIVGLELEPEKLWQLRYSLLGLGSVQMVATTFGLMAFWILLGEPTATALILGATLALSSTAFAIQLMNEKHELGMPHGRDAFSILLFQDLSVIPLLLLIPWLAGGHQSEGDHAAPGMIWGFVAIVGLVLAGRFLLNPWLRWLANTNYRELMTASSLLVVLSTAWLMGFLGLSMGLGAFLAGMLLANSPFRHQLEAEIEPFKGILLGLFFIAIGMSLELSLLLEKPGMIFLTLLALLLVKTLVLVAVIRVKGLSWREAVRVGFLLGQGGEFAFVLLTQAQGVALVDKAMVDMLTLCVGLSMAMTPLLLMLMSLYKPQEALNNRNYDVQGVHDDPEVVIAGFGRFGQIIGRILTVKNIRFTALDKDASHIDMLTKFGNKVHYGDACHLGLLQQAHLDKARLFVLAIDDVKQSLEVAHLVKEHFPHVTIIARARDRFHAYSLIAMGVPHVIRETLASSLDAAEQTMQLLGMPDAAILEIIKDFRAADEKLLHDSVEFRDDPEKLIEIAKQGRLELEALLTADEAR